MSVFELKKTKTILHLQQAQRRQFILAFILAIISFLFVTQLNVGGDIGNRLDTQPPAELGQIIKDMTVERDSLLKEISKLSIDIYKYRQLHKENTLGLDEAIRSLEAIKIASGDIDVTGKGIQIKINDVNKILAAYDLIDLIQELKASGAEALSVNGIRITARSFFTRNDGELYVDNKKVGFPVIVAAIGDPSVMEQALKMPGGYISTLTLLEGINVDISKQEKIYIGAADNDLY